MSNKRRILVLQMVVDSYSESFCMLQSFCAPLWTLIGTFLSLKMHLIPWNFYHHFINETQPFLHSVSLDSRTECRQNRWDWTSSHHRRHFFFKSTTDSASLEHNVYVHNVSICCPWCLLADSFNDSRKSFAEFPPLDACRSNSRVAWGLKLVLSLFFFV